MLSPAVCLSDAVLVGVLFLLERGKGNDEDSMGGSSLPVGQHRHG